MKSLLPTPPAAAAGGLIFLLALLAGLSFAADSAPEAAPANDAPAAVADASSSPLVRFETSLGSIDIRVFPEQAPLSSANFLALVDEGFYNGLIFHRVVANFVVQTGGYDAALTYRDPPRTVANESSNGLKNRRGTLSMARRADPDSADAQFFINLRDNPHLDPVAGRAGYSVFGEVIEGMAVVERIELVDTGIRNGMAGVPVEPIEIISAQRLP